MSAPPLGSQALQRGSSTVLNVSIFEEDLTTARLSLLQAHLDLALARIELQRATGVLLDNYRIRVDDDLRVTRDKS